MQMSSAVKLHPSSKVAQHPRVGIRFTSKHTATVKFQIHYPLCHPALSFSKPGLSSIFKDLCTCRNSGCCGSPVQASYPWSRSSFPVFLSTCLSAFVRSFPPPNYPCVSRLCVLAPRSLYKGLPPLLLLSPASCPLDYSSLFHLFSGLFTS